MRLSVTPYSLQSVISFTLIPSVSYQFNLPSSSRNQFQYKYKYIREMLRSNLDEIMRTEDEIGLIISERALEEEARTR